MSEEKKEKLNVLSLFDGMSCGQIALTKLGIEIENYYASEIDKDAMFIAKKNFPNIKHIGDVTKVKAKDLPKIDLLIGPLEISEKDLSSYFCKNSFQLQANVRFGFIDLQPLNLFILIILQRPAMIYCGLRSDTVLLVKIYLWL